MLLVPEELAGTKIILWISGTGHESRTRKVGHFCQASIHELKHKQKLIYIEKEGKKTYIQISQKGKIPREAENSHIG